jgi:hypothetical protein
MMILKIILLCDIIVIQLFTLGGQYNYIYIVIRRIYSVYKYLIVMFCLIYIVYM